MARDFKTLMRINDWKVDEKRRDLARELQLLENLQGQMQSLVDEFQREQDLATAQPTEAGLTYGAYATKTIERREQLDEAIRNQIGQVDEAREAVRLAFLEFKKFEIAEQNRSDREEKELNKVEQSELDEIGITAFVRKS